MNSSAMQPKDHVSYLRDHLLSFFAASGGSYLQVVNWLMGRCQIRIKETRKAGGDQEDLRGRCYISQSSLRNVLFG